MKPAWAIFACLCLLHIASANKRKLGNANVRKGGRGKAESDIINIDDHADDAFEFEGSGNWAGSDDNEGTDDTAASGDDSDGASGDFETGEILTCSLMREQSHGFATHPQLLGGFVPKCTPDGNFELMQCHHSTGECWCVNQLNGTEIAGSRHRAPNKPNCSPSAATTSLPRLRELETPASSGITTRISPSIGSSTPSTQQRIPADVFTTMHSTDPNNKINMFPHEFDTDVDVDKNPDTDNNYVEQPNVFIEPKSRKLTLRSTIIGQPGILAGIIGIAVIVLLCLVLLIMFIIYRMHRKTQDPAVYFIDKSSRSSLPSSNKKAGYTKTFDHDVYA